MKERDLMKSRDSIINSLVCGGSLHIACLKAHGGQWQYSHRWCLWEDTQILCWQVKQREKQFVFLEYAEQKEGTSPFHAIEPGMLQSNSHSWFEWHFLLQTAWLILGTPIFATRIVSCYSFYWIETPFKRNKRSRLIK